MDLTGSTRTTVITTTAVTLGGFTLTLYGLGRDQLTHSLTGVAITMIALAAIILTVIHHWVTDTRTERACLAAAQREAQAERTRYIAAQAASENEQVRLRRDLDAERARLAARARTERKALLAELEEQRATLVSETMQATFQMFHEGRFNPATGRGATIIRLPQLQADDAPQHERARGRGVVGP